MFIYRTDFTETLCFICNTKARDTFLAASGVYFQDKESTLSHKHVFFCWFFFLSFLVLCSCSAASCPEVVQLCLLSCLVFPLVN